MNNYWKSITLFTLTASAAFITWFPQNAAVTCESEAKIQKQNMNENWYSFRTESLNKSDRPQNMKSETDSIQIHPLNTRGWNTRTEDTSATKVLTGQFMLTAYSLDESCTGKSPNMKDYGITASGAPAKVGVTVAVDPNIIAYGSLIYISGLGWRIAEDTGGAIKGNHIDVLVKSYTDAVHFGVKRHQHVQIYHLISRSSNKNLTTKNFIKYIQHTKS